MNKFYKNVAEKGINLIDYLNGKVVDNYSKTCSDLRILENSENFLEENGFSPKYKIKQIHNVRNNIAGKLDSKINQMIIISGLTGARNKLTKCILGF